MKEIVQFSLERAADRLEIQHRIYQFCRAADRFDLEGARDAYHPDAFDNHGPYKGGVDGLFKWIHERHKTLPFSYHHVGNIYIEFSGPDEAMCESYVLTWQSVLPESSMLVDDEKQPGEKEQVFEMLGVGRYVDHFTRRDGAWRIQRRTMVAESAMKVPEMPGGKKCFGPDWAKGTRDKNDPSQVLRAELGLLR